jgi:drug/metabolite transporter (DMT)-like permease
MPIREKALAYLALIAAAMLWGSAFFMIQDAMNHDLCFMVAIRLMLAALGVLVVSRGRCIQFEKADRKLFLAVGFWLAVTFITQAIGLQGTSVANAAVITALFIVMTPALLLLLKKSRPTKFQWIGSVIGIFAFLVLGAAQGFSTLNFYDGITFLTAAAIAFHTVYFTELLKRPKNLYATTFYQFFISSLILFAAHFLTNSPARWLLSLSGKELLQLLFLGVCTSAFPYLLQAYAQLSLSPVQALLVISSEPFWAIAFANIFRGDIISGATIAACAILLVANIVAEIRGK